MKEFGLLEGRVHAVQMMWQLPGDPSASGSGGIDPLQQLPPGAIEILGAIGMVCLATLVAAFVLHTSGARHAFSLREVLRDGWALVTRNLALASAVTSTSLAMVVASIELQRIGVDSPFVTVAEILVSQAVSLTVVRISLASVDGETITFGAALPSLRMYRDALLAMVMTLLLVIAGVIALVVPGLVFAVRLQFADFLIVERGLGPVEALRESFLMTRRCEASLMLFAVVTGILGLFGLVTCGVGMLIGLPYATVMRGILYDDLASRRASEVQPPEPDAR